MPPTISSHGQARGGSEDLEEVGAGSDVAPVAAPGVMGRMPATTAGGLRAPVDAAAGSGEAEFERLLTGWPLARLLEAVLGGRTAR